MSMKNWFLKLFKSTGNEERIVELEKKLSIIKEHILNPLLIKVARIDDDTQNEIRNSASCINDHKSGHITRTQLNYIENKYDEVAKRHDALKKALDDTLVFLDKDLEDLKHRLGKAELMHAATSKKQNELFGDAMTQMIDMSGKLSIHIVDLAEKRIKEVTASMSPPDPDEFILILMNGKPKKVRLGTITHADILDIYFYPYLERKKSTPCSIIYENGGDEDKPSGTISENEKLVVKPGTVVNVTVL